MKEIKKTRTIEEVTGYEAFDGTEFTTKEECEKYENSAIGVVTKELEKLFIDERFVECQIYEHFGYGSEEFEYAIVDIKNDDDLRIINQYYELQSKGNIKSESLISRDYIGKRVMITLGYTYDREYTYPNPMTEDKLIELFKKEIGMYFNPTKKEEN